MSRPTIEQLSLSQAAQTLLDECRMVLPGLQAILGFQLTVVFSEGFATRLGAAEQRLHLCALLLVAVAVGLIMTPAAYHRQTSPTAVSERFIALCSRLLLASMGPLAVGISLDVYVVSRVILPQAAVAMAVALLAFLVSMWFVLPRMSRAQIAKE